MDMDNLYLEGFGEVDNLSEAASVISLWLFRDLITVEEYNDLFDSILDQYNARVNALITAQFNSKMDKVCGHGAIDGNAKCVNCGRYCG